MGNKEQRPANVTDVALWKLALTVHERHQRDTETDTCKFCGESWPCEADQRAVLADAAARRPITVPAQRKSEPAQRKGEPTVVPASEPKVEASGAVGATVTRHTPVWRRLRNQRKAG